MTGVLAASLVDAAAKAKTTSSSPIDYLFIAAIIAVLYFFLIRPRSQRQRQQREQLKSAEIGDEIATIGGLVGTIVAEDGDRITISTGNGTELVYLRAAIGRKLTKPVADAPDPPAAPEADAGQAGTQ